MVLRHHAIEAQIAGHGGFFRGGNFQQNAAGLGACQAQEFLGALASRCRDNQQSSVYSLRMLAPADGIKPDAEQAEGGPLPEALRRVQKKRRFKL